MKIIINPRYNFLSEYIKLIPENFEKEKGEILYESRNKIKRFQVQDTDIVVKRFKKPHFINRIVYSFFRKSKAYRSYHYSLEILNNGFFSPDPIAIIEEYSMGVLTESYYICCYEKGDVIRKLMSGEVSGHKKELEAFARYTADLHSKGILHLDYSPGNIIMQKIGTDEFKFSLIDVNRLKFNRKIDLKAACENVKRLSTSKEVLSNIMEHYATLRNWDIQATDEEATRISDRFFSNYTYRLARKNLQNIRLSIFKFRLYRHLRKLLPASSMRYKKLYAMEKTFYENYLKPYDLRWVLKPDYE